MSNTQFSIETEQFSSQITTLRLESNGSRLEYSASTDARVLDVQDGKIWCRTTVDADELASEIRAWGVKEARSLGYAVVFWS
jgi:hypothetical protein